MEGNPDIDRLADEQLGVGEEGWIRADDGGLVWVRVEPDGFYTPTTPPPLIPPADDRPIFGTDPDDD